MQGGPKVVAQTKQEQPKSSGVNAASNEAQIVSSRFGLIYLTQHPLLFLIFWKNDSNILSFFS